MEIVTLSRVAESLFWMGRYIDRTTNVARLADAAQRIEAIPGPVNLHSSEWASALIASGVYDKDGPRPTVKRADAIETLFFSKDNPSSVYSCFYVARENARAVRADLSQEVWEAINDTWLTYDRMATSGQARDVEQLVDDVKAAGARIRGSINESLLRNDAYYFIKLGQALERIDSMARLVDVKYHVLLPAADDVGSAGDRAQWNALLRASAAQRAYSYATKSDISARGVAQFLLFSWEFPRSLVFNARQLLTNLNSLEGYYGHNAPCRAEVVAFVNWIENSDADAFFSRGLHEVLTDVVERGYQVANALGASYGFANASEIVSETADGQDQN